MKKLMYIVNRKSKYIMIRSTPMYVTRVQRDIGVLTLRPMMRRRYPPRISIPPLYRQDYHATQAASKIQAAWRDSRIWKHGYNPVYPHIISDIDGAFSHLHGFYPNLCATKIQAVFRAHMARLEVPKKRMIKWILNNLLV